MEVVKEVALAWGIQGFFAMAGCYFVISAIVGKLIPIPRLVTRAYFLKSNVQKYALGTFGVALLFPSLFTIYRQAVYGITPTIGQPAIKEEVKEEPVGSSRAARSFTHTATLFEGSSAGFSHGRSSATAAFSSTLSVGSALIQFGPTQSMACAKVESFGLAEQNIRRLKFGAFQNEFYVYLGNVNSAGGTNTLYLLTSSNSNSWPESGELQEKDFQRRFRKHQEWKTDFSFQRSGDSVDFRAEERTYRLTISRIYSALIGPNSVAIEICEDRRKASGAKVQRGL